MKKSIIAAASTWVVGIVWVILAEAYMVAESGMAHQIMDIILGAAVFPATILPVPLLIGLVQTFRTRRFPHSLFARATYVLLGFAAAALFLAVYEMNRLGV